MGLSRHATVKSASRGIREAGEQAPQRRFVRGAGAPLGNQGGNHARGRHIEAEITRRRAMWRQPHASGLALFRLSTNMGHFTLIAFFNPNFR